jgi:hypothetical protein
MPLDQLIKAIFLGIIVLGIGALIYVVGFYSGDKNTLDISLKENTDYLWCNHCSRYFIGYFLLSVFTFKYTGLCSFRYHYDIPKPRVVLAGCKHCDYTGLRRLK